MHPHVAVPEFCLILIMQAPVDCTSVYTVPTVVFRCAWYRQSLKCNNPVQETAGKAGPIHKKLGPTFAARAESYIRRHANVFRYLPINYNSRTTPLPTPATLILRPPNRRESRVAKEKPSCHDSCYDLTRVVSVQDGGLTTRRPSLESPPIHPQKRPLASSTTALNSPFLDQWNPTGVPAGCSAFPGPHDGSC